MEKIVSITKKDWRIENGFYIELNCAFCDKEQSIGASTVKNLLKKVEEEGWRNIESDKYGLEGYYCGCDYKQNT